MAAEEWHERKNSIAGAAHAIGKIIEDIGDLANVCGAAI